MFVLALDTCLGACSAAITDEDRTLVSVCEPMVRGHQERLAPMVREITARSGIRLGQVDRIGVTVGPGSFTGLRVGLAFAQGLALALDRPCVGVGTLEALAASVSAAEMAMGSGAVAAIIDAGRGQIYWQAFLDGAPVTAAAATSLAEAAQGLAGAAVGPFTLVGPGAALLADAAAGRSIIALAAPRAEDIARLARHGALEPPRPIYLRAPDAKVKAR